ncbi:MAG TPA: serine hydroxymethyltransferase, partial [Candidatus Wallbacteria bacterium]|nr:serine hydroxymethyltransferase [Candidatus Wallbacteria bacterium]
MSFDSIKNTDKEIFDIIMREKKRQKNNLELIASENFVSKSVL